MEPVLVEMPSSISVNAAAAVNLSCVAQGYPPPTYQWYKDGVVIPGEAKSFLYIMETMPDNRGSYSCQAYNGRGRIISDSATVNIYGNCVILSLTTLLYIHSILMITGVQQYIATMILNDSTTMQAFDEVVNIS